MRVQFLKTRPKQFSDVEAVRERYRNPPALVNIDVERMDLSRDAGDATRYQFMASGAKITGAGPDFLVSQALGDSGRVDFCPASIPRDVAV